MIQKNFFILLLAIVANNIFAQTSVFKVTGNRNTIYVGGTIHLLQKDDFPLPKEFNQAYDAADILVFETDIEAMNDPSLATDMMQKGMYSKDKTLETELSAETYEALSTASTKSGIPIALLNKMKPSMVVITLTIMELQKMGFTEEGIDAYYHKNAILDHKEILFFETVEEQLDILMSMGEDNEDEYIEYSLRDLLDLESTMEELKSAWKTGDRKEMASQNDLMKKDYPSTYKSLLLKRNNRWMKGLQKMMKTEKIEFVLVGALHLYGSDGILSMLEKKGFEVEQL